MLAMSRAIRQCDVRPSRSTALEAGGGEGKEGYTQRCCAEDQHHHQGDDNNCICHSFASRYLNWRCLQRARKILEKCCTNKNVF